MKIITGPRRCVATRGRRRRNKSEKWSSNDDCQWNLQSTKQSFTSLRYWPIRDQHSDEITNNWPITEQSYLKPRRRGERWPGPLDFLASSWVFTISLHSLWSLPVAVIRHGGIVFVLVYILLSIILGGPLLILETFLGQYSGLAPLSLYRHLAPVMTGVGVAVMVQAAVRSVLIGWNRFISSNTLL